MSTDYRPTTLDDYQSAGGELADVPQSEVEARFTVGGNSGGTCENCGRHVSADWVRVCGDNNGRVYGCPECSNQAGLAGRAAREGEK